LDKPTKDVVINYIPQPRQSEFHLSTAKYRLYIGAWRAGKSFAGCWEAIKKCILYPNNRGLIGRKDFSDLRETTIKTFFEICPPDLIKNYNKTEHVVTFYNGSEILFRELKDRAGLGS
jgi:phage terminase large subunit